MKRISEIKVDRKFLRKWLRKIDEIILALFIGEKVLKCSLLTLQEIMNILIWILQLDPGLKFTRNHVIELVEAGKVIELEGKYKLSKDLLEELDKIVLER